MSPPGCPRWTTRCATRSKCRELDELLQPFVLVDARIDEHGLTMSTPEIIVDVPLEAADFQCGGQFAPAAELNIWYHLLNVGYRTLMLGETDYPCMYDEGPGVGRTYVRLAEPPQGPQALESWINGLREGTSYFGDGRSHVFDLAVDGDLSREHTAAAAGPVRVSATVAAWLPEQPPPPPAGRPAYSAPMGWHLERARIAGTRNVLLEVLANGVVVATRELPADGTEQEVAALGGLATPSTIHLLFRAVK
jgi:hypothetical protein